MKSPAHEGLKLGPLRRGRNKKYPAIPEVIGMFELGDGVVYVPTHLNLENIGGNRFFDTSPDGV